MERVLSGTVEFRTNPPPNWAWMQPRNLSLRISLALSKIVDQDLGTTIIHCNCLMLYGPVEGCLLTTSSIIPNTCPFRINEHPRKALAIYEGWHGWWMESREVPTYLVSVVQKVCAVNDYFIELSKFLDFIWNGINYLIR